jgi:hypothetical protein
MGIEPDGFSSLTYEFEIQASEFLKFAEFDLQQGTTQGLANALTNAKRAIDCQVDTILGCFGLLSRRNFPQKINILSEIGIVAPRILNKVVKTRNYLEHDFKKPNLEQVEDAVDIATLFVILVEQTLLNFCENFIVSVHLDGHDDMSFPRVERWICINYDTEKRQFVLDGATVDIQTTSESQEIAYVVEPTIIRPKEKGYIELVKLAIFLTRAFPEKDLQFQTIQFLRLFNP